VIKLRNDFLKYVYCKRFTTTQQGFLVRIVFVIRTALFSHPH